MVLHFLSEFARPQKFPGGIATVHKFLLIARLEMNSVQNVSNLMRLIVQQIFPTVHRILNEVFNFINIQSLF